MSAVRAGPGAIIPPARPAVDVFAVDAAQAESLADLHGRCFTEIWSPDEIRALITMLGAFALVAGVEETVVGFALVRVVADEAEILALGVVPERRCAGVAGALVAALVVHAAARGARRLVLEVATDNAAAQALYRAAGFVAVGRRRDYYRRPDGAVDALILARDIADATPTPVMPCAAAGGADHVGPRAGEAPGAADPPRPAR